MDIFQSTLLHEERQSKETRKLCLSTFQSTLLHEERQDTMQEISTILKFQSTLLHEERQVVAGVAAMLDLISIHAPT